VRGIAGFAMRGELAAASMSALFAVLGLSFAPLLLISGAVIGLVTLRHGAVALTKVALLGAVGTAGLMVLALGQNGLAGLVVLLPWIPVACAAQVLRRTGLPGRALAIVAMFVVGLAMSIRQAVPDINDFWRERMTVLVSNITQQGGQAMLSSDEIASLASHMHQASLGVMMMALTGMVLMARWWQSTLYRPDAFGEEFRTMALPLWPMPVAGTVALAAFLLGSSSELGKLAGDVVVVLMLLFAVQGLAIAHERVKSAQAGRSWLIGIYMVATLLPQFAASVLALIGMADYAADFRQLRRKAGGL
jgi:hypothetical protein